MSDDWEEIRRLAGDLQRIQLSGASQKLSERNIVEIVMKLQSSGLLDVFHTSDGKKYITPQHLLKEIKEELYVCGGRISIGELSKILCVDFSHVSTQASLLVSSDPSVFMILGQLIDDTYLDTLSEEVNEVLQQKGTISISALTKDYDLPSEFMEEQFHKRIGSIIEGFTDSGNPKIIMTQSYVKRVRARIRGALSGISVPTGVASIIHRFDFNEELFFTLADELIRLGRIQGTLSGGKKASKATYIPHIYQKSQNDWVDSYLSTHSYLEYDALHRIGIQDPKAYIKKRFKDSKLLFLSSAAVHSVLLESLESSLDEVIASNSWIDARGLVPSVLTDEDIASLLRKSIGAKNYSASVLADSVAVSHNFIDQLKEPFSALIRAKAQEDVDSGKIASIISNSHKGGKLQINDESSSNKKEDRRKKATGGKTGGGTQGRETKTKSTKKKKAPNKRDRFSDSEDEEDSRQSTQDELFFMGVHEIKAQMSSSKAVTNSGLPEEVLEELARSVENEFNATYVNLAKEWHQSAVSASLQSKRKTLSEVSEKANSVLLSIRLFHKGISVLGEDGSLKAQLEKHLNRTIQTDLVNDIFSASLGEGTNKFSSQEQRVKYLSSLPSEEASPLLKIHKALSGSVEDFLEIVEDNFDAVLGIGLRVKPDKKRDRQVIFAHRQSLFEQLSACSDEALTLHLCALLTFQMATGQMLHASGKFVPQILAFLKDSLEEDAVILLDSYQGKVMEMLKAKDEETKSEIQGFLAELTPAVKKLPSLMKKNSPDNA